MSDLNIKITGALVNPLDFLFKWKPKLQYEQSVLMDKNDTRFYFTIEKFEKPIFLVIESQGEFIFQTNRQTPGLSNRVDIIECDKIFI